MHFGNIIIKEMRGLLSGPVLKHTLEHILETSGSNTKGDPRNPSRDVQDDDALWKTQPTTA